MVWVKLDDQFTEHPKVVLAGPLAGWLHVCGLVYCGRNLTDGFIPSAMVSRLATFDHIGITTGGAAGLFEVGHDIETQELIDILVDCGLWEEAEGGYNIHDYLDYNPSKADVIAERKANAKRQKDFQERHRKGNGQFGSQIAPTNGVTNTISNAVTNTSPVPVPVPVPFPREKDLPTGADAPTPPDCFPELFTASIKDIQAHAFTKSQWQQIIEAERAANGRKTLIKWMEAKLGGAGHPAIQAYREEMRNSPRDNQYADIIDAIGDNGDFGLWRSVVSAWRLHGWNPYNIAGMLDAYRAGGVKNKNDGDSPTHRRGASKNPTGLEAFDEFERLMGKAEVIDVSE